MFFNDVLTVLSTLSKFIFAKHSLGNLVRLENNALQTFRMKTKCYLVGLRWRFLRLVRVSYQNWRFLVRGREFAVYFIEKLGMHAGDDEQVPAASQWICWQRLVQLCFLLVSLGLFIWNCLAYNEDKNTLKTFVRFELLETSWNGERDKWFTLLHLMLLTLICM